MREHNIEIQIKRENRIIRLKNKGLPFKDIKIDGLTNRAIRSYYHAGLLRKTLKANGINTDKLSSSILTEIGTLNSLPMQLELIKKLQSREIKNRSELRLFKKEIATGDDSDAIAVTSLDLLDIEFLNDINSEYKLITKHKDLAEKIMRTMRKDKLEKYSQKTQDFCLLIMNKLYQFLGEQLEKRRVITVNGQTK